MTNHRITFVNSIRGWGGAELWVLETVTTLRDMGIQADIVAQPKSELLRRARSAGLPAAGIPIRFDAAPWTLIKLFRHFRRTGTTAIVANLTKDLKASAVAGRLANVSTILASRESDFPLKNKSYYKWYFRGLATGVLVNSEATRRTVLESAPWLPAEKVHLLYKGIDTQRFRPGTAPPPAPVVGFVGQLISRKGLLDLMAAWDLIDDAERPDGPILRLAGEGPLERKIRQWRDTLCRPEKVEILGFVEDVAAFHQGLSMLVMPSLAEGFGLAAAEASACGVPVVATAVSSLPEIVRHEKTGILVPCGDPVTIAGTIIRLLDDPETGRRLGAGGRRFIERKFTRGQSLERLLELTGGSALLDPKGSPE